MLTVSNRLGMETSRAKPGHVRPIAEEDIAQIAELHEKVFGANHKRCDAGNLRSYFTEIFCRNPWYDPELPSLAYQESDGRVIGCLGVMPRRMTFKGRPIQVAVTHNFMVEPGRRSTLAGIQLLKVFLSGPQDLSTAEGNSLSREIWSGFGGSTAPLYTIRWTRPLRPSQYLLSFLMKRGLSAPLTVALKPFCRALDAIAGKAAQGPFRPSAPTFPGEEVDADGLGKWFSEFTRNRSLRPEYDQRSLKWLLEIMARTKGRGSFRKVAVRGRNGEVAGWYLYYLNPGGVSEVVQIAARPDTMNDVVDHLFYDAWSRGVVAVTGQLDPGFFQALSGRNCLFHDGGGSWLLIHSKNSAILDAIHRGDAFFSRMEGEWWIAFCTGYV